MLPLYLYIGKTGNRSNTFFYKCTGWVMLGWPVWLM